MPFINWTELDSPQEFITVGTIVMAAVVGYVGYFWGNFRGKSVKLYKERLEALEKETEACQHNHNENSKLIHKMEGQIEVLKEIPLATISKDLTEIKTSIKGWERRKK